MVGLLFMLGALRLSKLICLVAILALITFVLMLTSRSVSGRYFNDIGYNTGLHWVGPGRSWVATGPTLDRALAGLGCRVRAPDATWCSFVQLPPASMK
jgi:hypothetical protein